MIAQRIPIHFNADPKKVILLYLDPQNLTGYPALRIFANN